MHELIINALNAAVTYKREGIEGRLIESIIPFPLFLYRHNISLTQFSECRRTGDSFGVEKAIAEYNFAVHNFILSRAGLGEKVLKPKIELYLEIYKIIPPLPLLGVSGIETIQNILRQSDRGSLDLDEAVTTLKALFEILRLRADEEEITTPEGREGWIELIKRSFDSEYPQKDNFNSKDYSIPADLDG